MKSFCSLLLVLAPVAALVWLTGPAAGQPELIDRTMVLLDKRLGDTARLLEFIQKGLVDKMPEVRNFAFVQIERAKYRATPVLVEELRGGKNREVLKQTMLKLDESIIPPLL